jgi:predicted NBD/HSP70 family sugar kinase
LCGTRSGQQVSAVPVAVAGTVQHNRLVEASTMGWPAVDLGTPGGPLPLLVGDDASLAGVAEARRGTAGDARTVLHLIVEVGLGAAEVAWDEVLTERGLTEWAADLARHR